MTHQYELMVILNPEIDERQVAPNLDKFLNAVKRGRERLHERSQENVLTAAGGNSDEPY